ncbi:PREDICTED: protein TPX2-like isoform X2 [Nelumbo nucifera]|uniref:Protein TPX2-like isoform X2 n=2 Tax=Nelumbo nucifera TaxID=4432 RepID=A0A1U8A241_NELNU|nr:PREDICTED: protein TPX2-like isoform X2 [Nelumbo nucifera]
MAMEAAMIDETYEFSAPRYFDFINGETEEEMQRAELWFETALSYAPSPFMPRIKTGRSFQIETLCDFSDAENIQKASGSSDTTVASVLAQEAALAPAEEVKASRPQSEHIPVETAKGNQIEEESKTCRIEQQTLAAEQTCDDKNGVHTRDSGSVLARNNLTIVETKREGANETTSSVVCVIQGTEVCTPKPQTVSRKAKPLATTSKNNLTAKKIASAIRNPSALKPKNQSQLSQAKNGKPTNARSVTTAKSTVVAPDFAQENQAIKRQKLEGGRSRQILNVKTLNLPHKSKSGLITGDAKLCPLTTKTRKEDRKVYVREVAAATPFVSAAEMVKKFQTSTREMGIPNSCLSLSHDAAASIIQRKPKLTLTRPKEPELETTNRIRATRVKSTAELEEEMMANIPKFKARPLNKKILEAPTLPALPRSTPQLPEFQEFHLKTMERANQHAETSTVVSSTESSCQNVDKPHKLTEPRTPRLETSLRARPPKVKSSQELEQEELEKMPKFKARPLNRKIFESKGDLGIFHSSKPNVTKPQEFHFATDERIPPPATVIDLFDKLSLSSEPRQDHQVLKLTTPNPFHLHTEERGAEKERRLAMELQQKQWQEEKARIPKATPYPYTTDYPVIPSKPEPKPCTKPEPFQLESLVRHEEEVQREMEERQRKEKEEVQMRIFKAQPIMKDDPIPVPEKTRKPLTQVQEFALHVDHRAVDRAEFDKKIKEKEMMYKRYREEYESAKLMEEEKALKQLRRTMIPHARSMPSFANPFHPQKACKETTKAKSPKLRVAQRKDRRRLVGVAAATSSAATNMR